jgi:hypothetical protein
MAFLFTDHLGAAPGRNDHQHRGAIVEGDRRGYYHGAGGDDERPPGGTKYSAFEEVNFFCADFF